MHNKVTTTVELEPHKRSALSIHMTLCDCIILPLPVEQLTMSLEDEREQIKALKKKHMSGTKDMQRQIQHCKRSLSLLSLPPSLLPFFPLSSFSPSLLPSLSISPSFPPLPFALPLLASFLPPYLPPSLSPFLQTYRAARVPVGPGEGVPCHTSHH